MEKTTGDVIFWGNALSKIVTYVIEIFCFLYLYFVLFELEHVIYKMYQFELLCRQFALKSLEIDYNFKNKAVYFFLFKKHVLVDK